MRRLLIVLTNIILLFLLCKVCIGDNGSLSICNIQSFLIDYDNQIERVILPCSGDAQSLYLNILNPQTLQIERSFYFDGLIQEAISINNGASLIVHLGELDGNPSTEEGMLAEVEYSTGNIIRTMNLDKSPNAMVIDYSEAYAYLAIGIQQRADPPPKIIKVSLSSFQIVDEVTFGEWTDDIEITPDGSKIYVDSVNVFPGAPGSQHRWGVGVFNTSDLTISTRVILDSPAFLLEMSYDGSELYISSGYVYRGHQTESGASLYIVNTITDEIAETLHFTYNDQKVQTWSLAHDCRTNKLYCTSRPKIGMVYPKSNLICELNLNDYSYSFFTMGENPIGRIAIAPFQNSSRLFAIEEGTPVVHWKDLP